MTKIAFLLTVLVTGLVCGLPVAPAQAQAARTFVSAAGSDSNNCTNVATPCRHFATAFAATAANGEIYVLDPANYGSLTITHAVSIEGHGWASIAAVSGSPAITINATSGKINIIGVVLDGTGTTNTVGIQFNSGGILNIRDSVIRNFTGDGIAFTPNTSSQCLLSVWNTLISDNGLHGIQFNPSGSGTMTGVLNHADLENNAGNGLNVLTSSQTINITINDSVLSNSFDGLFAESDGGVPVNIMVRNSTIANNSNQGVATLNTGVRIWLTRSTITENAAGWQAMGGSTVTSYADNNIVGNASLETTPPPIGYK
jgi:hypothetical protein